jgi:hypothetical protein
MMKSAPGAVLETCGDAHVSILHIPHYFVTPWSQAGVSGLGKEIF